MRYPHIFGFCLASLVLGVPFVIRTVCPAYEIYPSLVLPARASLLDVSGGAFAYKARELAGVSEQTGKTIALDATAFLDPIPTQMKGVLYRGGFRLDSGYQRRVYFKYLPFADRTIVRADLSAEDQKETMQWIAERLGAAGCDPSEFVLRKVHYHVDRGEAVAGNPEISDEKRFRLN